MTTKLAEVTKQSIQMVVVNNAVVDPLLPVLQDQVLDNLDSRLLPLWEFC